MRKILGVKVRPMSSWGVPIRVKVGAIEADRLTLTADRICAATTRRYGKQVARVYEVAGKNDLGLNVNSWLFVVDGRVYARITGNGERGQYLIRNGCWSTRVRLLSN